MMDGWQPIETAPKDGTTVFVLTSYGKMREAYFIKYWGHWIVASGGIMNLGNVLTDGDYPTHWMPLPVPPHIRADDEPPDDMDDDDMDDDDMGELRNAR